MIPFTPAYNDEGMRSEKNIFVFVVQRLDMINR